MMNAKAEMVIMTVTTAMSELMVTRELTVRVLMVTDVS